jgi:hypothetical protein
VLDKNIVPQLNHLRLGLGWYAVTATYFFRPRLHVLHILKAPTPVAPHEPIDNAAQVADVDLSRGLKIVVALDNGDDLTALL